MLPRIEWADKELSVFLNHLNENGVNILSLDGQSIEGLDFTPEKINAASLAGGELSLLEKNPFILTMQKSYADYDIFMLVNSAETEATVTAKIADEGYEYATVNIDSYSLIPTAPELKDGYAHLELSFAPLEAKFVVKYKIANE